MLAFLQLATARRSAEVANQCLNALPPILERINLLPVDEDLEAARLQHSFELIGKRHVLARIGDKDPCLGLDAPRFDRILQEEIALCLNAAQRILAYP